MPQRWNRAAQALPWPWHFSLQDLLSTCTEGIICVNSDFMIWFPHVVPMLRYLYCKGPSLLPPYPCTREPPYVLCTVARTSVLTYSATQATSSLKASFFFLSFILPSRLMNYTDLERENLSWEMWNAMWKRAFLVFCLAVVQKGTTTNAWVPARWKLLQVLSKVWWNWGAFSIPYSLGTCNIQHF